MEEVSIIGVDLATNVFQVHGAGLDGQVIYRKKLTRSRFMKFITEHPTCVVAMEACEPPLVCRRLITSCHATISNVLSCA